MVDENYLSLVRHYEACLQKNGDNHRGVDWPNYDDAITRYRIMLELINQKSTGCDEVSLLDLGCGAAHLFEYILESQIQHVKYSGLDLSEKFVELSRSKFPEIPFYCCDLLVEDSFVPEFDYIVMNGVFTEKGDLTFQEMESYFQRMLSVVFVKARIGIAFNVMSKHVDWERNDLFHLSFDAIAGFVSKELSRNFVIRNDYGLYEYTVYVYK